MADILVKLLLLWFFSIFSFTFNCRQFCACSILVMIFKEAHRAPTLGSFLMQRLLLFFYLLCFFMYIYTFLRTTHIQYTHTYIHYTPTYMMGWNRQQWQAHSRDNDLIMCSRAACVRVCVGYAMIDNKYRTTFSVLILNWSECCCFAKENSKIYIGATSAAKRSPTRFCFMLPCWMFNTELLLHTTSFCFGSIFPLHIIKKKKLKNRGSDLIW